MLQSKDEKRGIFTIISDSLFYMAILMILFYALTTGTDGTPKVIMGYSYFTVLTSSMQDEIPKGSFILVKQTDPQSLQEGDNITYMRDRSTSVTHKIVEIHENYQNSGARGFRTKGVNNINQDREIVYESNVVGRVILTVPALGAAISYLGANIYIVFIIFGLCTILSFCIRGLFAKAERRCECEEITLNKLRLTGNKRSYRLLLLVMAVTLAAAMMAGTTYGISDVRVFTNELAGSRPGGGNPPGGGGGDSTISVNVTKVWAPAKDHPESVRVQLYRDGVPYGSSVILNAGNNWTYRWTGLNRYYIWTADELTPSEGYTKTVSGDVLNGFQIINTRNDSGTPPPAPPGIVEIPPEELPEGGETPPLTPGTNAPNEPPGTPDTDTPPGSPGTPPKTGDDADPRLWLILLAASAFALRRALFFRKNQDKEGCR